MNKQTGYSVFLRDVFLLAFSAYGGPQAHIAMLFDLMVAKRKYLTEEELIELNALCQILPGPTSTQVITAIGYQIGGANLAYLTLLIWITPAVVIMTTAGIIVSILSTNDISIEFTKYIQPMAVSFVGYAAYKISRKVVKTYLQIMIMIFVVITSYFLKSPYIFPVILLVAGSITTLTHDKYQEKERVRINIKWTNLFLWMGVFILVAILDTLTNFLPIRIFETFYRNGSLIFGGGQVLIPLLYTEFVEFKHYLTSAEFLAGYAFTQSIPGPMFSFSSYIGALANHPHGVLSGILGGLSAALGVFLPGTFFVFFVIRIWDELKKHRVVRASLEGINAASAGMIVSATIFMLQPIYVSVNNIAIVISTLLVLFFTKIPIPFIILAGLIVGFIF